MTTPASSARGKALSDTFCGRDNAAMRDCADDSEPDST
jgi:hypothetical protein